MLFVITTNSHCHKYPHPLIVPDALVLPPLDVVRLVVVVPRDDVIDDGDGRPHPAGEEEHAEQDGVPGDVSRGAGVTELKLNNSN